MGQDVARARGAVYAPPMGLTFTEGIDDAARLARADALELRGARVLVTGATGFFGRWLLELLACAEGRESLGLEVHALSRAPEAFAAKAPELARHPMLRWHRADLRTLEALPVGAVSHVVHLATETDARLYEADPLAELATIVRGTEIVAALAAGLGARRVLHASSGAVYGPQPAETPRLEEDSPRAPDPTSTNAAHVYGQGKRLAETILSVAASRPDSPFTVSHARGFAFSGVHLPLDRHFAIGNFVRDAASGGPVVVGGDGTPLRSYLDGADLARYLLAMLVRGGPNRAYNLGSDEEISIAALAHEVAASRGVAVEVRGTPVPGARPSRYVPSVARARSELGLVPAVPRAESVARMFRGAPSRPR